MKSIRTLLFVPVLLLQVVACSSMQKDYGYMNSQAYQSRQALKTGALVSDENGHLNEDSIQKLLESKIKIPKRVTLAVVRLNDSSQNYDFTPLDKEIAKDFYNLKNWGPRVQSVVHVPNIMLPHPMSLKGLRSVAALLQADMVLVISPQSVMDWELRVLDENQAKSFTHLDVLLMDTRTGAIPYTFMAAKSAEVRKVASDYTNQEMMDRAKHLSEKKAYLEMQPQVMQFLNTVR